MGRRIRVFDPDCIYFVSNRTSEARFLLAPSHEVNTLIRRCLANAVEKYGIELYGHVFMMNHFHLILRAPKNTLSHFMRQLQCSISRGINRLRGLRNSSVFPQRYSCELVIDEEALLEKLEYLHNNPVRARLVTHPSQYPGVSSFRQSAGFPVKVEIPLVSCPLWSHLSTEEQSDTLKKLVWPTVAARTCRVLGRERCLRVDWASKPQKPKVSSVRKPLCHASSLELWDAYRRFFKRVSHAYQQAVLAWRQGQTNIEFPFGTYPPGRTRCECVSEKLRLPKRFRLASSV